MSLSPFVFASLVSKPCKWRDFIPWDSIHEHHIAIIYRYTCSISRQPETVSRAWIVGPRILDKSEYSVENAIGKNRDAFDIEFTSFTGYWRLGTRSPNSRNEILFAVMNTAKRIVGPRPRKIATDTFQWPGKIVIANDTFQWSGKIAIANDTFQWPGDGEVKSVEEFLRERKTRHRVRAKKTLRLRVDRPFLWHGTPSIGWSKNRATRQIMINGSRSLCQPHSFADRGNSLLARTN